MDVKWWIVNDGIWENGILDGWFCYLGVKGYWYGFLFVCLYYIEWKVLIVGVYLLYVRVDYGVILVI